MAYTKRENSYWIFSRELKDSNKLEGEEKRPYVITPLGTKIKRILITGIITYKNSDDRLVKMTVADYIGSFYLTSFKTGFSSEIAEEMDKYNVNDIVMVMGKVSSFKTDDGIFYFSINPELIKTIPETERYFWGIRTLYVTKRKLLAITEAMKDDAASVETLIKLGYSTEEAEDAIRVRENYADYDFTSYTNAISDINFESPVMVGGVPDESAGNIENTGNDESEKNSTTFNIEAFLLDYIKSNDSGPGCKYDDIVISCTNAGIPREKVDEILNSLGSSGEIYEVSLKRYKAL
jgi:RPA family protein